MWEATEFVWQVLALVAIPTTVFALLGRWIDARYGTTPWATLVGLVLALVIALATTLRLARRMAKKL
jgi:F0F1-type ATP synthase assembly protein I